MGILQLSRFYSLRSKLKNPSTGILFPPDAVMKYQWERGYQYTVCGQEESGPVDYKTDKGLTEITVYDDTSLGDGVFVVNIISRIHKLQNGVIQGGSTKVVEYLIKNYEYYQIFAEIIMDCMECFLAGHLAEIEDSHLKRFKLMGGSEKDGLSLSVLKYRPISQRTIRQAGMKYRCLCGITQERKNKGQICPVCHTEVVFCVDE